MQKLVYLSNSRDYTEQGNINENKYFAHINELLYQGWKVAHITHDVIEIDDNQKPARKETFVAFVLPEKPEDNKWFSVSNLRIHIKAFAYFLKWYLMESWEFNSTSLKCQNNFL